MNDGGELLRDLSPEGQLVEGEGVVSSVVLRVDRQRTWWVVPHEGRSRTLHSVFDNLGGTIDEEEIQNAERQCQGY